MINYLITGGTGFIGSNLVRRLVLYEAGNVFLIAENNADLWRLNDIISELTVFYVDLADFKNINSIVKSVNPDVVFHLASYGGLPLQSEQRKIFDINFYGTVNLLNACKDVGFDCFINTGSSSEYGMKDSAMHESDVVLPISDYGVSKAAATQFCVKEAIFNKLPVYTLRPFSVYGDYEMQNRLISTVLTSALTHNQINLSSESCVRDFIYVQDIVDLYLKIAAVKPARDFVFNGGTGIQSTIKDVVEVVESLIGSSLNVSWNTSLPRPWEPKNWKANIDLALNVLNWQPKYSLQRGLSQSLNWFKNNLNFYVKNYEDVKSCREKSSSL
ncbi:MAG: NAD-dependent epimerase/dehydratase [candidate division TM6 bacterium GW2011_GWF2_37_49]|nr:MAG: NAD-dependent epimerase/dehydratase [candidate division TM6 bacterium GW2011_GWF2_37_49]